MTLIPDSGAVSCTGSLSPVWGEIFFFRLPSSVFRLLSFFKSHIVLGKKFVDKQYPGYRFG
jgi:hypothetical protein